MEELDAEAVLNDIHDHLNREINRDIQESGSFYAESRVEQGYGVYLVGVSTGGEAFKMTLMDERENVILTMDAEDTHRNTRSSMVRAMATAINSAMH